MDTRDEILNQLRRQQRQQPPAAPPPAWPSPRQFADPLAQFTAALQKVKGEVYPAGDLAGALDTLDRLLDELGAGRVVANDEPPLSDVDLAARHPAIDWHIVGRGGGDLRACCAAADVGVSGVLAALVETGSLVVASGPGRSRLATLLPPVHIALVSSQQFTTDLFTWTAARQGALPANTVLISGPSKTADIEQTMSVGVHGPKRLLVIVYP
ncbi:MAG: lactate utilization protein [Ardenticatenaceae bacterium]|nr:lactate utilization protein [Ardenticatenaceae bacterium]